MCVCVPPSRPRAGAGRRASRAPPPRARSCACVVCVWGGVGGGGRRRGVAQVSKSKVRLESVCLLQQLLAGLASPAARREHCGGLPMSTCLIEPAEAWAQHDGPHQGCAASHLQVSQQRADCASQSQAAKHACTAPGHPLANGGSSQAGAAILQASCSCHRCHVAGTAGVDDR